MYLIKYELARKFHDQHSYNETVDHRFKYVTKKIHAQKVGIEEDIRKLKDLHFALEDRTNGLDKDQ